MEDTCRGFILKSVPYGDNSLIVKILTDTVGAASFIVANAKRKGKKSKAGLFSPMNHVNIAYTKKENRDLYNVKQISIHQMYPSLLTDMRKPPVTVYVAEALYKAVLEHHHDEELYNFALEQMEKLEALSSLAHFPQQFLVGLISLFGFTPHGNYSMETPEFYLNESTFLPSGAGEASFSVNGESARYVSELFETENIQTHYSKEAKRETRRRLEDYLKIHLDGRFSLLSGEVLEMVFDE